MYAASQRHALLLGSSPTGQVCTTRRNTACTARSAAPVGAQMTDQRQDQDQKHLAAASQAAAAAAHKRVALAQRLQRLRRDNSALQEAIGSFLQPHASGAAAAGAPHSDAQGGRSSSPAGNGARPEHKCGSGSVNGQPSAACITSQAQSANTQPASGAARQQLQQQLAAAPQPKPGNCASDTPARGRPGNVSTSIAANAVSAAPSKHSGTIQRQQQQQQQQANVPPAKKEHGASAPACDTPSAAAGSSSGARPTWNLRPPPARLNGPLSLVFVAAECAPWSKTGGLGDVMGALPAAMAQRGHHVMVVTGRYLDGIDDGKYEGSQPVGQPAKVHLEGTWHEITFYHCHQRGVDFVFVHHPTFVRRGSPYADERGVPFPDNLFRFALLSLAALEAPLHVPVSGQRPGQLRGASYGQDVHFIASDYHAALLPLYLSARMRPQGLYPEARCVLAIHNVAHQGSWPAARFGELGLEWRWKKALEWVSPTNRTATINLLKAGIEASDALVAVSPAYAAEIVSTPQKQRIDLLLAKRATVLRGIVNGIDIEEWDSERDPHLPYRYSRDTRGLMRDKAACKHVLQRELRLPPTPHAPLVGFVGRLDWQKGPDLLLDALPSLLNMDCQVVMLGTGAADYEERVRRADQEYGWAFRGRVGFSVPLAHRIMAGCDMLLMPSRFEPCGLNQMFAMRYGTVPVAAATGGLLDIVEDFNPFHGLGVASLGSSGQSSGSRSRSSQGGCNGNSSVSAPGATPAMDSGGTGFTFAPSSVEALVDAMGSAVHLYKEDQDRWRAMQLRGMAADWGWDRAAAKYEQVLTDVMGAAASAGGTRGLG